MKGNDCIENKSYLLSILSSASETMALFFFFFLISLLQLLVCHRCCILPCFRFYFSLTFSSTVSLMTLSFLSTPNFYCFLFPSPITFSHFFYFCCVHHLLQSLSIPPSLSFYSYTSHTFSHLFLCLYLNWGSPPTLGPFTLLRLPLDSLIKFHFVS